jgi:uncharacterized protein YjbI with pentapeptide repeats
MESADFEYATCRGCSFYKADLKKCNLKGADLRNCIFEEADLKFVSLQGARLDGSNMKNANLQFANLSGSNWKENTDTTGANLANIYDSTSKNEPPTAKSPVGVTSYTL